MSFKEESAFVPEIVKIQIDLNSLDHSESEFETKVEEVVENKVEEVVENKVEEVVENKVEEVVETKVEEVVENKVEEVLPVFEEVIIGEVNVMDEINKSLVDTFLDIIKTYDEKNTDPNNYFNKIGIELNNQILDLTQKVIIKTPNLLNEIENALLEVTKDNKIDTDDIPKFILIIQILYERIFNQKDFPLDLIKRSEFCSTILKFIIHTLVKERKVFINEDFLIQLYKLIDSCMNLISFSHVLDTPKSCCSIM
jgi:chemotaxis regulatin CheY-phosphate phosphatase CheZ